MNTSEEVIRLIKGLREKQGLSLEELAKRVGTSKSTIWRYENGDRQFPINDIEHYAHALNTTVETLLGVSSKRQNQLIPLVGTICAGDGLLAEQNIEEYIYYPFTSNKQPDFALRVKGDSMQGIGIENGDVVYLRRCQWAEYNGQIVAALLNDNEIGTLKRMKWTEGSPIIKLHPENENYDVIEVYPNQLNICGVYAGHFKPDEQI